MSTLVIDTSALPLVAYVSDVTRLERGTNERQHAEMLTTMVEKVLHGEIPDLIVVGTGPAAFTGLRAGIITARALARGWNIDCVGVSSLEALAASATSDGRVLSVIDARRREVYAAVHTVTDGRVRTEWGPEVGEPALIAAQHDEETVYGPGATAYSDIFTAVGDEIDPIAMARLGRQALADKEAGLEVSISTDPQYLRRPDIHGQ